MSFTSIHLSAQLSSALMVKAYGRIQNENSDLASSGSTMFAFKSMLWGKVAP